MLTTALAIFGGPGGGAIVAQSVAALAATGRDIELVGFLNDELHEGDLIFGVPVLGPFTSWRSLPQNIQFLAPLHKVKAMLVRAGIVKRLGVPEQRWATVIDPLSAIAPDAVIGPGCFIGPFVTIGPGARLGAHTVVRADAHVSHDCTIGNFVFIGTNAVICGFSCVHDGAYIAPAATVADHCRVGGFAVVGLASVVRHDVPEFGVVVGSPARGP